MASGQMRRMSRLPGGRVSCEVKIVKKPGTSFSFSAELLTQFCANWQGSQSGEKSLFWASIH